MGSCQYHVPLLWSHLLITSTDAGAPEQGEKLPVPGERGHRTS